MKKEEKKSNTKKEVKEKSVNPMILIIVALLIIIVTLVVIFKDAVLYQMDCNVRNEKLLELYSNRKIASEEKDSKYYKGVSSSIMLEGASIDGDKLNIDLRIKSDALKEAGKYSLASGLFVYNENKEFLVVSENLKIADYRPENLPVYYEQKNAMNNSTILTYIEGMSKELDVDINKLIELNSSELLFIRDIDFEEEYVTVRYTATVDEELLNSKELNIRINDPIFYDEDLKPYYGDKFIEWQFNVKL